MDAKQADLVRRIASVVGHELRNPMAVINNSSYFIKIKLGAEGKLDPKVEKHLGIVMSEIVRADKMIAEMLLYSRPLEVKKAAQALAPLIEDVLAALEAPQTVEIAVKLSPKAKAEVDEKHFKDVIRRLAQNAADAMPEGGRLSVELSVKKNEICVEIRDQGSGIKPEFQSLLFEPFATTKPRGLGLSLAIARKILEAHGGRIEAANLKPGASFKVFLPSAAS